MSQVELNSRPTSLASSAEYEPVEDDVARAEFLHRVSQLNSRPTSVASSAAEYEPVQPADEPVYMPMAAGAPILAAATAAAAPPPQALYGTNPLLHSDRVKKPHHRYENDAVFRQQIEDRQRAEKLGTASPSRQYEKMKMKSSAAVGHHQLRQPAPAPAPARGLFERVTQTSVHADGYRIPRLADSDAGATSVAAAVPNSAVVPDPTPNARNGSSGAGDNSTADDDEEGPDASDFFWASASEDESGYIDALPEGGTRVTSRRYRRGTDWGSSARSRPVGSTSDSVQSTELTGQAPLNRGLSGAGINTAGPPGPLHAQILGIGDSGMVEVYDEPGGYGSTTRSKGGRPSIQVDVEDMC